MCSLMRAECASFNGKGRKQRWTAISEVALEALRTYLADFRGWSEGNLFQTFDGRAASQSSHERHVHPSRPEGWGEPGQPPPLPPHLRYLGDSGQCPRARCPVPPWSFEPDDGPSLLCDLRLRAGGKGARCLQSGDAAVGEVRRGGRPTSHLPSIHLSLATTSDLNHTRRASRARNMMFRALLFGVSELSQARAKLAKDLRIAARLAELTEAVIRGACGSSAWVFVLVILHLPRRIPHGLLGLSEGCPGRAGRLARVRLLAVQGPCVLRRHRRCSALPGRCLGAAV